MTEQELEDIRQEFAIILNRKPLNRRSECLHELMEVLLRRKKLLGSFLCDSAASWISTGSPKYPPDMGGKSKDN